MTAATVDETALRTNQAFIVALTVGAFVLGDAAGRWLVLAVGLVLLLGTLVPRAALFKLVYLRLLKPAGLLKPHPVQEDPAAPQFAQGVGAAFLLAAFAALATGATLAGWVLAWIVIVLAAINLVFGFCAGCFVYYQLGRLGILRGAPQR